MSVKMQVCTTARLIQYIVTVHIYGSLYIYIISVHTAAEVRMTLDLHSDHMRSKAIVCNHSILFQEQMMGMMVIMV